MPDGSIPDPRQNPNGEKPFGFAYNYSDGHYYVYIKKDDNEDPDHDSRYFIAGSQVKLGKIKEALIVVKNKGSVDPGLADKIDEILDEDHKVVRKGWKSDPNSPVIFEFIEVDDFDHQVPQEVVKECNKTAKNKLNPGQAKKV